MKEETHGGTYRHTHGGDIQMKEQTYGETYAGSSLHRVECGGDIRIHTVGPRRGHTHGGGKHMME